LATALGYFGGNLNYLPHYGIDIYPWGNFTVFLYPIIMAYAIIRFDLMDIRILVRRTALILFVYFFLLLASAPILYFFHVHNQMHPSAFTQPIETVLVSLILSTGPFFYAFVVRRKSYFQEYTLAGLTHELKSPLAVIDSALDFLNSTPDLSKLDTAQLSAYLKMIERNSSRLRFFVNDLLHAFHQPHTGANISTVQVDLTVTPKL
jgi:signal transduction histidine kinase